LTTQVIKLNSRGIPQSRLVILSRNHLYLTTPRKKCKRRIPIQQIRQVAHTKFRDSIVCINVQEGVDLILVVEDQVEFVNTLKEIYLALTTQELVVNVTCEYVFSFSFFLFLFLFLFFLQSFFLFFSFLFFF